MRAVSLSGRLAKTPRAFFLRFLEPCCPVLFWDNNEGPCISQPYQEQDKNSLVVNSIALSHGRGLILQLSPRHKTTGSDSRSLQRRPKKKQLPTDECDASKPNPKAHKHTAHSNGPLGRRRRRGRDQQPPGPLHHPGFQACPHRRPHVSWKEGGREGGKREDGVGAPSFC